MRDKVQVLCLGILLFTLPGAFRHLAAEWYPTEYGSGADNQYLVQARLMRRNFWVSAFIIAAVVALVLLVQHIRKGGLPIGEDWLRVMAVILALMAALGRGGWAIQTWKGQTVIERIDRGMYMIEQLGAAALLIFAITL